VFTDTETSPLALLVRNSFIQRGRIALRHGGGSARRRHCFEASRRSMIIGPHNRLWLP